jgi:hypothetical protein
MTTTILRNYSWLGDDDLDLSELIVIIILCQHLFLKWCDYSKDELPYSHRLESVGKSVV